MLFFFTSTTRNTIECSMEKLVILAWLEYIYLMFEFQVEFKHNLVADYRDYNFSVKLWVHPGFNFKNRDLQYYAYQLHML